MGYIGERTPEEYDEWMESLMPHARDLSGNPTQWKELAYYNFQLLVGIGLLPEHRLLEVRAGCLDTGRLIMAYLDPGNYWFIEETGWPGETMVDIAYANMVELVERRKPHRRHYSDFKLSKLWTKFDFILVRTEFCHATQAQVRSIMDEAYKALYKRLHATLVAGFYDQGCGNNTNPERTWPSGVVYTAEFITEQAKAAGFTNVQISKDKRHPVNHTWLFARR